MSDIHANPLLLQSSAPEAPFPVLPFRNCYLDRRRLRAVSSPVRCEAMDKTWSDTYAKLTHCMTHGVHVSLRLQGGETIAKYRSYDIVAPAGFEIHIDMAEAVVRGIVWPDGGQRDRLITLRDIEAVREERFPLRYLSDDRFYKRNPIPEGWVRVGNCPPGPAR